MRRFGLSSVSFLVLVAAGSAMAQSGPRNLPLGQPLQSTMGPEDPVLSGDDSSYELFQIQAPKGQLVTVSMTSSAFRPVITLGETIDDDCETCVTAVGDTDRPATARRVAPESGILLLRANTMLQGDRGAFTLLANSSAPPRISARPLPFGQSVTDKLDSTDVVDEDGSIVDSYAVRLAEGQEIQFDLSSDDFDPKLQLLTPAGVKLAEDDDGGPGTQARIRYKVPRAGLYQVRVLEVGSGEGGAYTLSTGVRPQLPPMAPPIPLTLGRAVNGVITQSTPHYEAEGEDVFAVRYGIGLEAGKVYKLSLSTAAGSELDPKLAVGEVGADGSFEVVAQNDDGGDGSNAILRFRPEKTGNYIVEAQRVGTKNGSYQLKIEQAAADRAPEATQALRLGQSVTGQLLDGGARLATTDILFATYSIALRTGQRVVVTMDKTGDTDLDPVLEIGLLSSVAFQALAKDDDGGQGTNARIKFTAPSDGTYIIRATTNEAAQEGAYGLAVNEMPPQIVPPFPARAKLGETIRGSLGPTDPSRNDSQYFDRYVFNGQIGETYEISANAENFDILVGARQIDRVDDDYVSDDDGGGGTNAKLVYTVTTSGQQVIRVTSVEEGSAGDYSLLIIKK